MAIPVLKEDKSSMKYAFDAAYDQIFEFEWEGNQAQRNTLEIWRNDTNGLVYSATQTTMTLRHILPAGTLENGRYYRAKISVWYYDINNQLVQSERSTDSITFYCYTSPEFAFVNVVNNMEVKNANYTMECLYKQTEGERLDQYQFIVYDEARTAIYSSAVKYAAVFADPTNAVLSDAVSGLTDNMRYYFRCIGTTQNGMKVDTGYIAVSVNYEASLLNGAVVATNVPDMGAILITSNFQLVWGQHSTGHPVYLKRSETDYDKLSVGDYSTNFEVDLTDPNHFVTFEGSLSLDDDFTIKLLVRNMIVNSPILSWTSEGLTYTATWRSGFYEESEPEPVNDTSKITMLDQTTNKLYDLYVSNKDLIMSASDEVTGYTSVTMTDRVTGGYFDIFVSDGQLMMGESTGTAGGTGFILTDQVTGKDYSCYLSAGKFTLSDESGVVSTTNIIISDGVPLPIPKHWMELTIEAPSGLTWFYMSDVLTIINPDTSIYIYLARQKGTYVLRIKDMGVTV